MNIFAGQKDGRGSAPFYPFEDTPMSTDLGWSVSFVTTTDCEYLGMTADGME